MLVYALGFLLLGALASLSPLTDHLGYEFAELGALYAGTFGAWVGVWATRRSLGSRPGRGGAQGSPLLPPLLALALILPAVALHALLGLQRPSCDPRGGAALLALLAGPSALVSCALGQLAGRWTPRRELMVIAPALVFSFAFSAWPILRGPQVFLLDPFLGWFPGPIYDAALLPSRALLCHRLLTVGLALSLSLLAHAAVPGRGGGGWRWLGAALVAVVIAGGWLLGPALHLRATREQVDAVLGARVETAHLVLHLPRESTALERELLARDAEASWREVRAFFGLPPASARGPVEVFIYRSPAEKRLLVGAAETSFTKPWLRQIHINWATAPHPVLRHELAHAAAADLTRGLFGVPGRLFGLIPDMPFIEGAAVAADWPGDELTVGEKVAALRKLGLLPPLRDTLGTGRFYAESGPRAYLAVGALVRWLWSVEGPAAVAQAYGRPEGLRALPGLSEKLDAYERSLASPPPTREALDLVAAAYSGKGLVSQTCGHEVAELAVRADLEARRGDLAAAAESLSRCAALQPDDAGLQLSLRRALSAAHLGDRERALRRRLLDGDLLADPQRGQLLLELTAEAWGRGETGVAQADLDRAQTVKMPRPLRRTAAVLRFGLAHPETGPALSPLLSGGAFDRAAEERLAALDASAPESGLAAYLLARHFEATDQPQRCAELAASALSRALPDPLLVEEATRVRAACALALHDDRTAQTLFRGLAIGASPGLRRSWQRWADLAQPAR